MKKFILLIFVLVFIKETKGQAMFQKTYAGVSNENIYTAKQTSTGGYIIAAFLELNILFEIIETFNPK